LFSCFIVFMLIGIDASRANEEHKTGVGWYAYFLICELKKHLSTLAPEQLSTLRIVLYTNKPLQGELANLPVGWEEQVLNWRGRFWTQLRLSWEMLVNPPDVLFIPAHVFPIIHPKRTVMTVHDVAAIKFSESYNWFENWYTVWSAKYAVKKLWKVIVPSQFTKQELISDFRFQISDFGRVEVISHGYDKRYEIKDKNVEQKLSKYDISQPYLLSIGRLEHKKNTVRIIKAFEGVKKNLKLEIRNLKLVLVGQPGHGYHEVHQAIVDSPYKEDIITPGWVSEEDLPALMQGAEIFVFPSLYEGFGMPVLEAMSASVPVVASSDSSLKEVGENACLYANPLSIDDIAEKILQLLQNKELREEKVKLGLERATHFSWQRCAEETWKVLNYES
jgi:glycosyltransferase involved in cell wall biosynthesis